MHETESHDGSPLAATDQPRGKRIELWRLQKAHADLRGVVIGTSFGYALGLELATELIVLHLQPSLEALVAKAERMETALIAQGWALISTGRERSAPR